MDSYEIMQWANGVLLVMVGGLLTIVWNSVKETNRQHDKAFEKVWETFSKNQEIIQGTLRLASQNQLLIQSNQKIMEGTQVELRDQGRRINRILEDRK